MILRDLDLHNRWLGPRTSEPLNKDGNWQVGQVCIVCMRKKEPEKLSEHTSEHVKFWGRAPRTPSHSMGPIFVFALGPHNPLGGPAKMCQPTTDLDASHTHTHTHTTSYLILVASANWPTTIFKLREVRTNNRAHPKVCKKLLSHLPSALARDSE